MEQIVKFSLVGTHVPNGRVAADSQPHAGSRLTSYVAGMGVHGNCRLLQGIEMCFNQIYLTHKIITS